MNREIAHLGVQYRDWRISNTLMAPQVPPGLPGIASSRQPGNRVYKLRLIDFERALWTKWTVDQLMIESEGDCQEIARRIEENRDDEGVLHLFPADQ